MEPITLEHILLALRWSQGKYSHPRLVDKHYYQSVWTAELDPDDFKHPDVQSCGTYCCIFGAARIIAGLPEADKGPSYKWVKRYPDVAEALWLLSEYEAQPALIAALKAEGIEV